MINFFSLNKFKCVSDKTTHDVNVIVLSTDSSKIIVHFVLCLHGSVDHRDFGESILFYYPNLDEWNVEVHSEILPSETKQ